MSLAFVIIACLTVASAVAAMSLRNLVHCALALALTLAGLAACYLQLGAQFVGFAQILVYVGAVAILIVFAILLTLSIVVSLKVIGALLVEALVLVPAASARNIARGSRQYFVWSVIVAFLAGAGGLGVSTKLLVPTGGAVVLAASAIFFVTLAIGRLSRRRASRVAPQA